MRDERKTYDLRAVQTIRLRERLYDEQDRSDLLDFDEIAEVMEEVARQFRMRASRQRVAAR